ncbi:polar amino acid transport system substrate-binding protein [Desulfobaculum xiamenense]|uniref:Polar amino acid transport system substrate-binding protein n=1 Tax=Desulfobaculum xiamenense TaxID=995050 RepID=A0A846QM88_9BACT|nr:ABC transporter substrate-binding protein [Desulfobaculum xiamenense]NJB69268.1 polar amino acid transport system substrate-binding protein [Desulfobaculum xiamenense]
MGKKLLASVIGLMLTAMLAGGAIASEKVYVNGIDFGFPPFGFVDKHGEPTGFDVEAVNWIADKMGFKVRHQPMDWDGIIPALNAGKIDFIASGMSATAERAKVVNFTKPYFRVTQVLVVRGDNTQNLDEILTSGKTVAVQRGTNTVKYLEELAARPGMNFKVAKYDSTDLSMQDLPIGRIDGSAMDSTIAYEMMKGQDYRIAGVFDAESEDYCYAVRKADAELLDKLNKGLDLLKADPYWEELKAKWNIH